MVQIDFCFTLLRVFMLVSKNRKQQSREHQYRCTFYIFAKTGKKKFVEALRSVPSYFRQKMKLDAFCFFLCLYILIFMLNNMFPIFSDALGEKHNLNYGHKSKEGKLYLNPVSFRCYKVQILVKSYHSS